MSTFTATFNGMPKVWGKDELFNLLVNHYIYEKGKPAEIMAKLDSGKEHTITHSKTGALLTITKDQK